MKTPEKIWKTIWPVLDKHYKRTATFLDYKNPWQLLVAVILSAQTTDDMVNRVTPDLFKKFPTPKKLATAPIAEITRLIKRIGYYNSKAGYIKRTSAMIAGQFKNKIPEDVKLLQTLPGVGRKTAVAVLSNAFNKNIGIPVDTHVIRFVKRFHLSHVHNPSKIEQELLEIIPEKNWRRAGYAIKEYGRKEGRARGWKPNVDPVWKAYQNLFS